MNTNIGPTLVKHKPRRSSYASEDSLPILCGTTGKPMFGNVYAIVGGVIRKVLRMHDETKMANAISILQDGTEESLDRSRDAESSDLFMHLDTKLTTILLEFGDERPDVARGLLEDLELSLRLAFERSVDSIPVA